MTNEKLTKKDLKQAFLLSCFYQGFCLNYETMMSTGFVLSIEHCLKRLFGHDPETVREKNRKYLQFYNTNANFNPLITGIVLSLEETRASGTTDAALALRTGLMGPLAGIGDSLFFITAKTVFCSIVGYMAIEGSALGLIICLAAMVALFVFRGVLFYGGYKQGAKFITEHTDLLKSITNGATILGLTVVGAMIPSTVRFATTLTFTMGEATATLDEFFNAIIPSFLPVVITACIYFGLKSKRMTTVRMIWLVIVLCIVLSLVGVI